MVCDLLVKHGDFEVFGIDQRGNGQSGGERAVIEYLDQIYDDQWLLIFETIKKYEIN